MEALCPACQAPMVYRSERYFTCERCRVDYLQQALCPECGSPLQKLQGCGATDFLCQNGHGLVSKRRVIFSYRRRENGA